MPSASLSQTLQREWLLAKHHVASVGFVLLVLLMAYALPYQVTPSSDNQPWLEYHGAAERAPSIALAQAVVRGDSVFLDIEVNNFILAEQCLNPQKRDITGHIHVYVNSQKWLSSAAPLITLTNLPQGDVRISVSLNQLENHRFFVVNGKPVQDSVMLQL